jgi:glycosyltransferase involved in cell wall biosynthesis
MSREAMRIVRIQIFQPVIARYQVPFFEHLAAQPGFNVRVASSFSAPGAPASDTRNLPWASIAGNCVSIGDGRLVWQPVVRVPEAIGRGDVVIVDGNPRYLSTFRLIWQARKRNAGVMWWGHGWSPTSIPWRASLRYRLMNLADTVTVYTDKEAESLREDTRLRRPIFGANNTIDTMQIDAAIARWDGDRLAQFRKDSRIEGTSVLLFCGRLRRKPSTELNVLLRALKLLLGGIHKIVLVVIGSGECERELQAMARELGVGENVKWLGSVYDEYDLAPWFLSAKLFVYPGSIGLSLLQAFAYGLPVVTHSDTLAHGPEIAALKDGVNGRLFARGDCDSLRSAISSLLGDEMLRREMAENARTTMRTSFSLSSMVDRFSEAIRTTSDISQRRAR